MPLWSVNKTKYDEAISWQRMTSVYAKMQSYNIDHGIDHSGRYELD